MVLKSSDATSPKHLCALHLLNLVYVKVLVSIEKTATHCGDGIKASANGVCLTLYSRGPVLSDGCGLDPGEQQQAEVCRAPSAMGHRQ